MTKDEWKKIIIVLEEAYKDRFRMTEDSFIVWYDMLKDISFDNMKAAAYKLMTESEFAPTIAALRKRAAEIVNPIDDDPYKAWEEARKAIRDYGMYKPEKALASLSPRTREVVEILGFSNLCHSENQVSDRARFIDYYKQQIEKEKQNALMPPSVKAQIEHNKRNQPQLESGQVNHKNRQKIQGLIAKGFGSM